MWKWILKHGHLFRWCFESQPEIGIKATQLGKNCCMHYAHLSFLFLFSVLFNKCYSPPAVYDLKWILDSNKFLQQQRLVYFYSNEGCTWNDWHDDHVEHVVEKQSNGDGNQDKLTLVFRLLQSIPPFLPDLGR